MSRSDSKTGGFALAVLVLCAVAFGVATCCRRAPRRPGSDPMSSPAKPQRLVIPALKIRAPVQPIEVNDQQVLDPPRNPRDVGWWKRSARVGATKGQTVLTGHTVHTGGGVMDDLGKLHRGQRVKVVTGKGTMVYRTTKVVTWSKDQLAERAADLFSQEHGKGRLVLITCSQWTGSYYKSNVIVFAEPLGVADKSAKKDKK